ncbi:MAG: polysaccharide pyruvyl transferase family protein [Verrucomicrobiota bacterium]
MTAEPVLFSKAKVGVHNAYDARNLGDQAIVQCQLAWIKCFWGSDIEYYIYSHHWQFNQAVFGRRSCEPLIYNDFRKNEWWRMLLLFYDILRAALGHSLKSRKIGSMSLCFLCGGGYLYSSKSKWPSRNLIVSCLEGILIKRQGIPVILFPQTIGPISKFIDFCSVKYLINKLDFVMVRDSASMKVAASLKRDKDGLLLVPDIVLSMRKCLPELYRFNGIREGIGIAAVDGSFAMAFDKQVRRAYLESLIQAGKYFHFITNESVRLFVQVSLRGRDDDRTVVNPLAKRFTAEGIPVEIIDKGADLSAYLEAMQRNRLFIGSRMHACIFALTCDIPTVGLAYQPKFFGLFEMLDMQEHVCQIEKLNTGWLIKQIKDALLQEQERKNTIKAKRLEMELEIEQKLRKILTNCKNF